MEYHPALQRRHEYRLLSLADGGSAVDSDQMACPLQGGTLGGICVKHCLFCLAHDQFHHECSGNCHLTACRSGNGKLPPRCAGSGTLCLPGHRGDAVPVVDRRRTECHCLRLRAVYRRRILPIRYYSFRTIDDYSCDSAVYHLAPFRDADIDQVTKRLARLGRLELPTRCLASRPPGSFGTGIPTCTSC